MRMPPRYDSAADQLGTISALLLRDRLFNVVTAILSPLIEHFRCLGNGIHSKAPAHVQRAIQ